MTTLLELPAPLRAESPSIESPSIEPPVGGSNGPGAPTEPRGQHRLRAVLATRWPWLGLIAVGQIVLTRVTDNLPDAFQDEGLYVYMGHRVLSQLTGGAPLIEYPGSYFSGAPDFYPVLAALADGLGGLQAARDLSLAMVIVTMIAVDGIARNLFGRLAGVLAAASFAVCGSVIFLSQWATFDALAMMMAALAAWLAVVSTKRDGLLMAPVVGLLLFGAAYAKYAGAVFIPIVAGLAVATGWSTYGWRIVRRALFMVVTTVVVFLFVVLLWNRELLAGLRQTTTDRSILHHASSTDLSVDVLTWIGPWLGLAAIGGLVRLIRPGSSGRVTMVLVVGVLLVGSVLAPAQQVHLGEFTSLNKHVAFGIVFASVLIGDLAARMARLRWTLVLAPLTIGALLVYGLHFGSWFRTGYSDDTALQAVLKTAAAANPGQPILGEQPAAQRYELMDQTAPGQWYDTWELRYRGLTGSEAYTQAVNDHYFGVIYLDLSTTNSKAIFAALNAAPVGERYYHLEAIVPGYLHGDKTGSWLVWAPQKVRYTSIPGSGQH